MCANPKNAHTPGAKKSENLGGGGEGRLLQASPLLLIWPKSVKESTPPSPFRRPYTQGNNGDTAQCVEINCVLIFSNVYTFSKRFVSLLTKCGQL